ncbi:hypothetical protein LJC42_06840 [Eubacteriales bacterium OttesenSCG-928-K08]|nr:hypothetical protein [Eubacteriales bacterium OttesenSCG-928-K08]
MPLFLSFCCLAANVVLLLDRFYFKWQLALPQFAGAAIALAGLLIAGLEYRAARNKKKKRLPRSLVTGNAILGIIMLILWITKLV